MKKINPTRLLLVCLVFSLAQALQAQVGINTDGSNPHPSAMLDVQSTDKGMLVPRLDSTSRKAIMDPAVGLLVYDSTTTSFWYYDELQWNEITQRKLTNGLLLGEDCRSTIGILTDENPGDQSVLIEDVSLVSTAEQVFTHTNNEPYLRSLDIKIGGRNTSSTPDPEPLENGTLRIIAGDDPGGAVIHTQAISLPDIGWNEIIIDDFVPLVTGDQYTIQLEEVGSQFSWEEVLFVDGEGFFFRAYANDCAPPFIIEPTTERRTVSLSNIDTIRFSNGVEFNGVLPTLTDIDGDTKIEVEQTDDDDIIRFSQGGLGEFMTIDNGHFNYRFGFSSIYFGRWAGESDQNVSANRKSTGIGVGALRDAENGNQNTAVGTFSLLQLNDGGQNTAIGHKSLGDLRSGSDNVAIGNNTGFLGPRISSINNSVLLGTDITSIDQSRTYRNVVAIGSLAVIAQDSSVVLGNAADVGIGTNTPDEKLHVVGRIKMEDGNQQAGYVLTSDGDGVGSWQANVDTDDQTLSFDGANLTIADGNTVDISSVNTDTDDQTLSFDGTNLTISEGNTVDISIVDTDNQTIDKLNLNGTTLELSLEDDGEADQTVDLASIDTDDQTLTFDGSNLTISEGNTVDLSGLDTDDQTLAFDGANLSISEGNTVDISGLDTDTDDQTLAFDGANLSISEGNSINISGVDTDDQTLTFDGANLTIADGNTVDISSVDTNTDDQTLTFDGANLTISEGNTVDISTIDTDTDDQTLTFDGANLSISEGNTVDLSAVNSVQNVIQDTDGDTQIQVEESTNENNIRFDVAGNEAMHIDEFGNVGIGKEPSAKLDIDVEIFESSTPIDYLNIGTFKTGQLDPAWQSFTATCNCPLASIQLSFESGFRAARMRIYEGEGTAGNVLHSSSSQATPGGIITYAVSNVNLVAGNIYTIGLNDGGEWKLDAPFFYSGGRSSYDPDFDYAFSVTVLTDNQDVQFTDDGLVLGGYTLPYTAGNEGQVLEAGTAGTVSWEDKTINTDNQTLSFDGANLSIADGNTVDISTIDTDDQTLAFDGANLSISEGNTVDISTIDTDTDDQTLAFDGANLSISEGNTVDISTIDTDTDDQTLAFDGANLSISEGNTVDISTIDTDTDDQTLAFDGANLSISEGNTVDISTIDTDTDDQTLSFNPGNKNLSIADGNSVDLSSINTDEQALSYNQSTKNLSISGGNSVDLTQLDVPVGTIIMWIGDENETVPTGWLVCDNRLYDTNTYADLFAMLGSNRTPNFLGRFPVGAPRDGINGATAISVGGSGGEEDKELDLDNIPPHTHSISYRQGSESGSGNTYSDIGGGNDASSNTSSAGEGESFKIMPPFLGVQFLIRAE